MALIWAEGFDCYGTNMTILSQRGYTILSPNLTLGGVANARTGTGCLLIVGNASAQSILRILDSALTVCGQGCGFMWTALPLNDRNQIGLRFGVGAANNTVEIVGNASLGISVYNGGVLVGSSANNVIVLNSYYWLEARVSTGTGTATIEVRLNGVQIVSITGLTIGSIARCLVGKLDGNAITGRLDDWIIWDNSGTINNSFLGDRRCVTTYPNADTALEQWTPSIGSDSFAILDNAPPVDTEFVQANAVNDISEFGMQPIGINSNDVAGVVVIGRAAKLDAGATTFRLGINSAGTVVNSASFAPNVAPSFSYFNYIVERNPNGNIPWTRTTANAALPRITRDS